MPPTYFPLRWESTGDQWWFASPIDWAAANGHYDLVRELLHIDTNLLIKLTSLPRIRRLETVWDDEESFSDVANCRSQVARKLLQECETKNGQNSLIRAGYGGWLLYTAASAGDVVFVRELLDRDPLLVFGEGEYGVSDMLYAAARSKNCDVFRLIFECCVTPRGGVKEVSLLFRSEMVNRAVHAAARGGNLEVLREFLGGGGGDVLAFRDARGSTVLHTASSRGQVEVVKHLISSYDILNSVDNRGNTALNVAAFRGHLAVFEVLISASPSMASLTNHYGDTFLHMAVSGFRTPSFRRVDRQMELMKQLVGGKLTSLEDVINVQNNDGRTALHVAVTENIQSDVVELLMSALYINLNIRDGDGNTPLDLLKQRPRSASSEILIKRLISAGGISDCQDQTARNAIASHLRMHGIGGSPGTSFRIPDAEIFLYTGIDDVGQSSCDLTSTEYGYSGEIERAGSRVESSPLKLKKLGSFNRAKSRLKNLLRWPGKKQRDGDASEVEDNNSLDSCRTFTHSRNSPRSLRQQFARASTLPNNKRILSLPANLPSPFTKKKFAAGLTHGVLRVLPKSSVGSPSSAFSEMSWPSPAGKGGDVDSGSPGQASRSPIADNVKMKRRHGSFKLRLMNSYLCLGAQGLAVENSMDSQKHSQNQENVVV
ncbi:hypothetical protein Salat_1272500 [Sesamum alatum]|uniref:Uncharacterized protein n=1 Tax=Sesamum alatum TaxID=300844 RepID=A0AAE1YGF7_9LAMI|nr:hypothetical protein Salat_1272500 [Sesamum alatum]